MTRVLSIGGILGLCAVLSACSMENDMRLPKVPAYITSFEVDGQESCKIDNSSQTVSLVLTEQVDIEKAPIRDITISENAKCTDRTVTRGGTINLSSPKVVVLRTYQDYSWTISATQPVERYVKCDNQVGEASIHPETKTVSVTVNIGKDIYNDSRTRLTINDMKLEIEGSKVISTTDRNGTVSKIDSFPVTVDCFYKRTFTVQLPNGTTTDWQMIALPSE